MEQNRKLRVYRKYSRIGKNFRPNPEIRLIGKWLEKWGFKCGGGITVRNLANGIIIIKEGTIYPPTIYL